MTTETETFTVYATWTNTGGTALTAAVPFGVSVTGGSNSGGQGVVLYLNFGATPPQADREPIGRRDVEDLLVLDLGRPRVVDKGRPRPATSPTRGSSPRPSIPHLPRCLSSQPASSTSLTVRAGGGSLPSTRSAGPTRTRSTGSWSRRRGSRSLATGTGLPSHRCSTETLSSSAGSRRPPSSTSSIDGASPATDPSSSRRPSKSSSGSSRPAWAGHNFEPEPDDQKPWDESEDPVPADDRPVRAPSHHARTACHDAPPRLPAGRARRGSVDHRGRGPRPPRAERRPAQGPRPRRDARAVDLRRPVYVDPSAAGAAMIFLPLPRPLPLPSEP